VAELVADEAIASYSFDGMDPGQDGIYRDLAAGFYGLTYTDTSGCTREQVIEVSEAECGIYIPNVFSPNGDGVNDVFSPYYTEDRYTLESFRIFNRWGSTILDCTNPCTWDGSAGEQQAASGVYLYVLILESTNGELIRMSGDVTLIR
jgi:gliding motility-associated-like protein